MSELTSERIRAATDAVERALHNNNPDAVRDAEQGLQTILAELKRLRAALEGLKRPIAAGIFGIPYEEAHRLIQEIDETLEGGERSE